MNSFAYILKTARLKRHLSQQKLAEKAGVSLATIQNIEAGVANPAFSTIENVLQALSLELYIKQKKIDWNALTQIGVPLIAAPTVVHMVMVHPAYLKNQLSSLAAHVESIAPQSREGRALAAFLCALHDHFPTFWKELDEPLKEWFEKNRFDISPKLRRISLQRLAEYL